MPGHGSDLQHTFKIQRDAVVVIGEPHCHGQLLTFKYFSGNYPYDEFHRADFPYVLHIDYLVSLLSMIV